MAGYNLPVPSGQSVRELHEKLVRAWDPRFIVDIELRDLVHQRNAIEVMEERDDRNIPTIVIHSGRAGGIVEHATGLLMAPPSWHVTPEELTTEEKRDVEIVERALANIFEEQLVKNDFWSAVGRDILIFGRSFVLAMPMPEVWTTQAGYPVRTKREEAKAYLARVRKWKASEGKFPFVIKHISTLSILPLLDANDNVLATIEEKWVTAKILAEEMNSAEVREQLARGTLRWYDELCVIEYIDCEYVAYFLAGITTREHREIDMAIFQGIASYTPLRIWKHGLGKHPVVMISGIKTEVVEDYAYHWKGFLEDAKDSFQAYDLLLSRLATMVYAYYMPSYEWKLAAASAAFAGRERPPMEVNLGGVTVTFQDETLRALEIPTNLPPADLLIQHVDDIIQRATLEDVLFGRVDGNAPAFQVNLRIQVAKSKLSSISGHMGIGLVNIGELVLRGIQQLGEAVEIGGETITVRMAAKYQNSISVALTPKNPVERNADIGAAKMALEIGLPFDWVVENVLNVEDPATLRLQKDILEIEQLPQVKEKLMTDALEQLDILINDSEYTALEDLPIDQLPQEMQDALAELQASGGGAQPTGKSGQSDTEDKLRQLLAEAGMTTGADTGGLGRGPFPEGSAPQSLAPRGLLSEKAQPQPGAVETSTDMAGLTGAGY